MNTALSEAQKAVLKKAQDKTVHGIYARAVQVTGVPLKKHCPHCAQCEGCVAGEDDPCPELIVWAGQTQIELMERGASEESAEQITRLLGILRQGYAYLAQEGLVKIEKGVVIPQPICKHLGVYENSLARVLRDCGLNRAHELPAPDLEEYLARKVRGEDEEET